MSSSAIVEESEPLQRNLDGWVGAKGEFKVKVSANSERAMCTLVAHPGFVHVLGATQLIMVRPHSCSGLSFLTYILSKSLAFLHSHDCAEREQNYDRLQSNHVNHLPNCSSYRRGLVISVGRDGRDNIRIGRW
jgi:hypothetical protein